MKQKLIAHWPLLCFFGFWAIYFALFWSRAVFYDSVGNFWAGHVNIWGDWAAHFTMGTAMAERGLFIDSPFLIHSNFSYPFVADYLSGLLMRWGVPIISAFTVPSFLFSMLIVVALYYFYKTFFQSKKVAVLGTTLFLFNGGLGFYYFIKDVVTSAQPLYTFLNPPHEYTRLDAEAIKWISVIDSMIIPQRSFPLGFSCALLALAIVYLHFFKLVKAQKKRWKLFLVGILLGFLPIIHTHSFLATFLFLSWWVILDLGFLTKAHDRVEHLKDWAIVAISTSVIALPIIKIYFANNVGSNFLQWLPGWMASELNQNWLLFTWKNWGITPLLAVIAWVYVFQKAKHELLALLILPSFGLFILSNLFLFQPWSWDNTKLLVWFLLGSSGLIAYLAVHMYNSHWKNVYFQQLKIPMIAIVLCIVSASGIIDAYRVQRISLHSYPMYVADEVKLAEWVKKHTDKNSIWLTAHPHNHWQFNLTGRQPVMAYPGWLWTQGYDYIPVSKDVSTMFAAKDNYAELFESYGVNYVVIGPNEVSEEKADQTFFDLTYPVVYELGPTRIYKVK